MVETKDMKKKIEELEKKPERDWPMIVLLSGVALTAVLFVLGAFLGWFKPPL